MARRRYRIRYVTGRPFDGGRGREPSDWVSPFPVAVGLTPAHFKCPLPANDAEFAILSRVIFGVPLSLKNLWVPADGGDGQAEIAQSYDTFHGTRFAFAQHDGRGYDRLGWLFQTVIGPMGCSRSLTFTTFRIVTHRQGCRLRSWDESRRSGRSSAPRPAFVRLARCFGAGENTDQRVDLREVGVLAGGREDGAPAASLTGTAQ